MAAGKSTIGKRLARTLALPFVDTDVLIENVHGTIKEIFELEGEAVFREYELQAVHGALSGPPAVIAVGGGAVTHPPTLALLAERSHRVFLEVRPATVVGRVKAAKEFRPVLGGDPSIASVEALYSQRLPLYAQADYTVDADRKSAAFVVADIVAWLTTREPLLLP